LQFENIEKKLVKKSTVQYKISILSKKEIEKITSVLEKPVQFGN